MILLTGVTRVSAQELTPGVLSTSGGMGTADGTAISWTVGELMVQTFSADTLMLTQGFEQGEITVTTSANELSETVMDVQVYPNPVRNILNVDFHNITAQRVRIELMSLNGQTILIREVNNPFNLSRINLNGAAPGTYLLEVSINGKSKTFKIVKR